MKTKIVLLILFLLMTKAVDGQIMFERHYGGSQDDGGSSVLQTDDGGYIVAGTTMSYGNGSNDIYILKTDANGNELWVKTCGGNGWDAPYEIKKTLDNCYIITGKTSSFGAGASDAFLLKINSIGDSLWFKTYGGLYDDGGNDVVQTIDGGYIIIGVTLSYGIGTGNMYLIKTNWIGDTIWTKTYGGTAFSNGYSVNQTIDGGYIISGFDMTSSKNMVIIKTNNMGDMLWEKKFEFRVGLSYGTTIISTIDGGYAVLGTNTETGNFSDIKLLKVDENGDSAFTKLYGGINNEAGYDLIQTNDNGFIIIGLTQSSGAGGEDVFLIKTNEYGVVQWTKLFGGAGDDWGGSVQQTSDYGYIIAGYTKSFGNNYDIFLIKTDENGVSGFEKIIPTSHTLKVYPNPSDGLFTIQLYCIDDRNGTIQIFNLQGQEICNAYIENQSLLKFNFSNKQKGMYIVRITTKSKIITNKIIIY